MAAAEEKVRSQANGYQAIGCPQTPPPPPPPSLPPSLPPPSGVMPYLPYCKQSKMHRRGCIAAKLVASMLAKAGMTHLLTMDLYHKQIQGFFDFPVDNLRASPFLIQHIKENVSVP